MSARARLCRFEAHPSTDNPNVLLADGGARPNRVAVPELPKQPERDGPRVRSCSPTSRPPPRAFMWDRSARGPCGRVSMRAWSPSGGVGPSERGLSFQRAARHAATDAMSASTVARAARHARAIWVAPSTQWGCGVCLRRRVERLGRPLTVCLESLGPRSRGHLTPVAPDARGRVRTRPRVPARRRSGTGS